MALVVLTHSSELHMYVFHRSRSVLFDRSGRHVIVGYYGLQLSDVNHYYSSVSYGVAYDHFSGRGVFKCHIILIIVIFSGQ